MNPFVRYRSHLVARASGLSRLGWYWASSKEALPWVIAIVALVAPASLLVEPQRTVALLIVGVPLAIGLGVTQFFMLMVHLNDLRARARQPD